MRKTFALSTLAAALLATGCAAVGPRYEAPVPQVPETFATGVGLAPSEAARTDGWWRHFGDPALDALVAMALADNRDLRATVARLQAARARRGESELGYLPAGGVAASHQRERRPEVNGGGHAAHARTVFDAAWELDLFGRVASEVRAADARVGAAEARVDDLRLTLAAEVARTYFEWRGAQRRGALLRTFATDQQAIVDLTAHRVDAGRAAAEDLSRARAQLAADRAAFLAEQDREQRFEQALAVLVGQTPGAWTGPADAPLAPFELRTIAVGDPARLLRDRPDVRAAERRLAAATADIGIATAGLFPQVRINGSIGYAAGGLGDLGSAASGGWLLGPSISWGLLDLGRIRASIRAHRHVAEATLAEYEATVLRALADAQAAFAGYGLSQERLAALSDQAAHARTAAELSHVRYEEGEGDYLGALDAARTARLAETALLDGLVQQRIATVAVHKALGAMPAGAGA